jgi:hypothetical protein
MHRQRADTGPRSQPEADNVIIEGQGACGPRLIFWRLTGGEERAVRDTDSRQIEHRTEVQGQPGASRVVSSGRVHQKYIRGLGQTAYGSLEYGTYSKRKQARLVGRASGPDRHVMPTAAPRPHQRGCRPRRIADGPAAAVCASKANEASTDR